MELKYSHEKWFLKASALGALTCFFVTLSFHNYESLRTKSRQKICSTGKSSIVNINRHNFICINRFY